MAERFLCIVLAILWPLMLLVVPAMAWLGHDFGGEVTFDEWLEVEQEILSSIVNGVEW